MIAFIIVMCFLILIVFLGLDLLKDKAFLDKQTGYNDAQQHYFPPMATWTTGVSLKPNYKIPKFINKRKPRYLKRNKDV